MPENGFVMRFFGCARWGVGVVGAERSIHLSYGRKSAESRPARTVSGTFDRTLLVHRLLYHIFSPW